MKIQTAKASQIKDEYPNFEEIAECQANCRFDLNKEKPRIKIIHVLSKVEYNELLKKYFILTQIGFTE